jgi:glutathione-independent formaldehyde dehydrogenase
MSGNRGVVYVEPGKVDVRRIAFPELSDPAGRKANQGVILRVVATNICGSDRHMVRGSGLRP